MPYKSSKRSYKSRSHKSKSSYRSSSGSLGSSLRALASSIKYSRPRSAEQQASSTRRAQIAKLRSRTLKMLARDEKDGGYPSMAVNQLLEAAHLANEAKEKNSGVPNRKDIFGKVRGRGGYWGKMLGGFLGGLTGNSTIKSLASSAFDSAGDYMAGVVPGGNMIASGAEMLHKSITGSGDYNMAGVQESMSGSVPSFGGGEVDHIRIRSREYLGPISGSSDFQLFANLLINPGNHEAFPQLAKMAAHYQQYIMKGCIFYYKATSSVSVATADPSLGQVIMAFNYDSAEPPFESKAEMLQSQYCSAGAPPQDIAHGVECAAFSNGSEVKRIRHGNPTENTGDPMNTDIGRFQLAVEGTNAAASRIGELWVTYDVMLLKGKDSRGSEIPAASFEFNNCTNIIWSIPVTKMNTLGATADGVDRQLTFPRFIDDGQFLVQMILISNVIPDPANGAIEFTATPMQTLFRPPVATIVGGSLKQLSPGQGDSIRTTTAEGTVLVLSEMVNAFVVTVRTNTQSPVCRVSFDTTTVWPGGVAVGKIKIVITRIPDLLKF